ncbi:MAG: YraN family protein [Gammaproteobacteria bacterium]
MQTSTRSRGQQAETLALDYLKQHKLQLLCKNYRGRFGEIDLIMRDTQHIIFVEVRYRSSTDPVHPLETIDAHKQGRIIRTSQGFLQRYHAKYPEHDYRFDVVTITGDTGKAKIDWIQNAFGA